MIKKIGEESFMNHFYNSYFPNHNRAFHINNLQKGVEKNLPGVEGVDFAERGRSTPKGVGVGRSVYSPLLLILNKILAFYNCILILFWYLDITI